MQEERAVSDRMKENIHLNWIRLRDVVGPCCPHDNLFFPSRRGEVQGKSTASDILTCFFPSSLFFLVKCTVSQILSVKIQSLGILVSLFSIFSPGHIPPSPHAEDHHPADVLRSDQVAGY